MVLLPFNITPESLQINIELKYAGFEAYLVGGCVRDLLLNKVRKKFRRAIIVGKRFPICRVPIKDTVVEVSSFETVAERSKTKQVGISHKPTGCDPRDFVRWKNCMHRDFTVN
ncbi:UNVERIFIED_CONTAM: Poly(A) polymerase I, partial [Sesamum radiatum]